MIDYDSDNDCTFVKRSFECKCHINDCPFLRRFFECECYNDSNFNFEDEVNITHKFYNKRRKNYCDVFRLKLCYQNEKIERLKNKIAENSILINEKPDDWKKYVSKEIKYKTFLNEEKNNLNKIIEKHKDNMFINSKNHDKLCCEVIKDYYQLTTGFRRF